MQVNRLCKLFDEIKVKDISENDNNFLLTRKLSLTRIFNFID